MGGGASDFQAVLDGVLAGAAAAPASFRHSCVTNTPDSGLLLSLLGVAPLRSGGAPMRNVPGAGRLHAPRISSVRQARPAPPRPLTSAQREALTHLREAGASTLDDAFTPDTLKQAFRQLALRYHPDRHPGCTEHDRRRLAAAFAGVHDAYRTLLGMVDRTH